MSTLAVLIESPPLPAPPLPPLPPAFTTTRHTWTSWDGDEFDLSDVLGGVVLLAGPLEGLLPPPHERFTSTSPARAGSRSRGGRDLERPVFWTLGVFSDRSSAEWLERHRRFWRSMDRRRPGVWTVHTPGGESRSLVCRFVKVEDSLDGDPLTAGWAVYGISLVADEQPYWRGEYEPAVFDLGGDTGADFIPATGAPEFNIVQASTIAGATVTNPGDVVSWPVWTVYGATPDAVLGVGSDVIGVGVELGEGDVLRIDTHRQSTTLNGQRVRGILNPHEFAPIPPRSTMPLNINATGTGRIVVDVVPLFEGAL